MPKRIHIVMTRVKSNSGPASTAELSDGYYSEARAFRVANKAIEDLSPDVTGPQLRERFLAPDSSAGRPRSVFDNGTDTVKVTIWSTLIRNTA